MRTDVKTMYELQSVEVTMSHSLGYQSSVMNLSFKRERNIRKTGVIAEPAAQKSRV